MVTIPANNNGKNMIMQKDMISFVFIFIGHPLTRKHNQLRKGTEPKALCQIFQPAPELEILLQFRSPIGCLPWKIQIRSSEMSVSGSSAIDRSS